MTIALRMAMMQRILTSLSVLLALAGTASVAVADPYDDGMAAAQRRDYVTAMKLWRPLADQGNVAAQRNLGSMYYRGDGVEQDFKEAAKWWQLAAVQGDVIAATNLGSLYYQGSGVPKDYTKAATWFRLAAAQGNSEAQNSLGTMYDLGQGVAENRKEAATWYRLAAEQGHPGAQFNLGALYARGDGVPQDNTRAYVWFTLAASVLKEKDAARATQNRDSVAQRLTEAQLADAQAKAQRCKSSKFQKCE